MSLPATKGFEIGSGFAGVLEANFVEPAHDKQGFERTNVLARLEARLVQMQKSYWSSNCHKIGYAPRRQKKLLNAARDSSPESPPPRKLRKSTNSSSEPKHGNGHAYSKGENGKQSSTKFRNKSRYPEPTSSGSEDDSECDMPTVPSKRIPNSSSEKASPAPKSSGKYSSKTTQSFSNSHNSNNSEIEKDRGLSGGIDGIATRSLVKGANGTCNGNGNS